MALKRISFPKEYPRLFTDAILENESEPCIPVIMDYSLHRLISPYPWYRDIPLPHLWSESRLYTMTVRSSLPSLCFQSVHWTAVSLGNSVSSCVTVAVYSLLVIVGRKKY